MNPLERALDLLRLARRPGTAAEGLAAAKLLAKHLERHRISAAELEAAGQSPEGFVMDPDPLGCWTRIAPWRVHLVHGLCRHFGVALYRERRGRVVAVKLCGRKDDVDNVRHFFAWLDSETTRLCREDCRGAKREYRRDWCLGFAQGVLDALAKARAEVTAEPTANPAACRALVLRQDGARNFMLTQLSNVTVKPMKGVDVNRAAFTMGALRGYNQHLGKHLTAGKEP